MPRLSLTVYGVYGHDVSSYPLLSAQCSCWSLLWHCWFVMSQTWCPLMYMLTSNDAQVDIHWCPMLILNVVQFYVGLKFGSCKFPWCQLTTIMSKFCHQLTDDNHGALLLMFSMFWAPMTWYPWCLQWPCPLQPNCHNTLKMLIGIMTKVVPDQDFNPIH